MTQIIKSLHPTRSRASFFKSKYLFTLIELLVACQPKLPERGRRPVQRVFTLIELLVVIAVISILISMLLPALKSARDKTLQSGCANNLKQYNHAIMMYSSNWDGYVPLGYVNSSYWSYLSNNTIKYEFKDYLGPGKGAIVGYVEPYVCPADKYPFYNGHSYGINSYMASLNQNKMSVWKHPSKTFLLADAAGSTAVYYSTCNFGVRHGGGMELLYGDGHVDWLKYPAPTYIQEIALWSALD